MQGIIEDVVVSQLDKFTDYRGDIYTIWDSSQDTYNLDKISKSRKNVIRGIHGDTKSTKLMTCTYGEVYLLVLDVREHSNTYGNWMSFILDDINNKQVKIPPGVGNGYCVLSHKAVVHYKWSFDGDYVDANEQFTVKWNDQKYYMNWPISNPILSERDK